jgi:2-keto-4-pentenoate hydratase/2-oxohepta-3-ene-1,7-dioic acid hydratase in catechol pathway
MRLARSGPPGGEIPVVAGDVAELEIDGLGQQRQTCKDA